MEKPIVGKPFTFEMTTELERIAQCGTDQGILNLIDNYFWNTYGEDLWLEEITFKPIRIEGENTIVIQVSCESIEAEEEE